MTRRVKNDADQVRRDADLSFLRDREDFKKLLAELERKARVGAK